jgi:hypothetical protein
MEKAKKYLRDKEFEETVCFGHGDFRPIKKNNAAQYLVAMEIAYHEGRLSMCKYNEPNPAGLTYDMEREIDKIKELTGE